MRTKLLLLGLGGLLPGLFFGNATLGAEDYQAPRTEWGQPDLQGVWNYSYNVPLERPRQYGERQFLTEEEIEQLRAMLNAFDENSDAAIPNFGVDEAYNDFWIESAGIGEAVRTSIITYPPDGRLPAFAEGAIVVNGRLAPDIEGERPVRVIPGGIGKDGPGGQGSVRTLHHGFQRRAAARAEPIQQQLADFPESRTCGPHDRDGA